MKPVAWMIENGNSVWFELTDMSDLAAAENLKVTPLFAAQPPRPEDLIAEMEHENRLLRARNERVEREIKELAERVAQRLEKSDGKTNAGLIRETFDVTRGQV